MTLAVRPEEIGDSFEQPVSRLNISRLMVSIDGNERSRFITVKDPVAGNLVIGVTPGLVILQRV